MDKLPPLLLRPELLNRGISDDAIQGGYRRADLRQLRPGVYVSSSDLGLLEDDQRQQLIIAATLPKLDETTVLSHTSAARLHGLPVWQAETERSKVHIISNKAAGGKNGKHLHRHVGVLDPAMVTMVGTTPVTSVARTVFDSACILSLEAGVAMADFALHHDLTSIAELVDVAGAAGRRRNGARARKAIGMADRRSESSGESFSRVILHRLGLPMPDLQFEIRSDSLYARCDFGWKKYRVVGEFDGRIKYGRLLKPDENVSEVLWNERQREQAIMRHRWGVVRWIWDDFASPARMAHELREAFTTAAHFVLPT